MISRNYMAHTLRSHLVLLVFAFVFLCLFHWLILLLVVTMDFVGFMQDIYRQMPPQAQFLFGQEFLAQFSVSSVVAFGYNHPMVLVMLGIVAILLPARHVAGEIEDGTLELLFSLPVRRSVIGASLWLVSGLALLGLVAGGGLGTSLGLAVFPEARVVPLGRLAVVAVNLWLLMLAVSSYTFLLSAFAREGGTATLRAAGLTLIFYFLDFAVKMWPAIDVLQPFTVFHYYQPRQTMIDASLPGSGLVVLGLLSLVCGALAVYRLSRRDIPG